MKKLFCIMMCTFLVFMSAVCVSASEDKDMTEANYIYFQVPTESAVAWNNFNIVFCHIWSEGEEGADFYAWQAKDERCEDLGNGYWRYDISALEFEEDKTYAVIFSNENGMQTYNLTITSACKGDIAVCEGDMCVNPVDSEKKCAVARWLNNGDKVHPSAQIGSDGTMLDPDAIFNTDVDLKWGTNEGASYEMPEVEIPTEPETEPETKSQDNDTDTDTDTEEEPEKDNNMMVYIIIGGAVLVVLIIVVAVVFIKRKK